MSNKNILPVFVCLMLILILAVSAGCVALTGNPGAEESVPASSTSGISQAILSSGRSTASFTDPIAQGDSPQLIRDLGEKNGEMTTENLRVTFRSHAPIFQTSFSPRFSSQAIRVDVKKGPLLVNYQASARQYDPRISFLVITIRDLDNGKIVAEDGYGEPFTSNPEKQIIVYGSGPYHINVYGNQMNVNLAVYTGDSA
jgi:hypothetical protein